MASIMSGLRDMVTGGAASSGQPAKLQSTAACAGLGPEAEVQKRFFEQQSFREKRPETDEKGLSQAQVSMRTKPDCGEEGYRGSGKMLGKIALITGGDSGIGRAIAIAYAREGADLCLVYDKNDADANEVKALVEAAGRRCLLVKADVSSRANCVAAVQRCVTELGGLTTLVNNAAIQFGGESEESGLDKAADHIERVMAVNLFSNVYLSAEAVKHFKEDTGCAILFVTSVNPYKGHPDLVSYTSSKAAQVGLLRSLSKQYKGRLCRVNGIAPGPVWTPLIVATPGWGEDKAASFGKENPMQRAAQPVEMAPAAVFLASSDSSFMDGQVLHLDGGMTTAS